MTTIGLITLCVGALFANNIILSQMLGACPFIRVSRKIPQVIGMGIVVTAVMTIATACTWFFGTGHSFLHVPDYAQTLLYVLCIIGIVQSAEMIIHKQWPAFYDSMGIYLPYIMTNCAILGVVLLHSGQNPYTHQPFSFLQAITHACASGIGFTLALVLMVGVRQRIEAADVPLAFKGLPVMFVAAGLISLVFAGFAEMQFFK